MISVAVKGYGVVIWDESGEWRTYGSSEALTATLSARVEQALGPLAVAGDGEAVRGALLSISGAQLLADECDHGPGGCDSDIALN